MQRLLAGLLCLGLLQGCYSSMPSQAPLNVKLKLSDAILHGVLPTTPALADFWRGGFVVYTAEKRLFQYNIQVEDQKLTDHEIEFELPAGKGYFISVLLLGEGESKITSDSTETETTPAAGDPAGTDTTSATGTEATESSSGNSGTSVSSAGTQLKQTVGRSPFEIRSNHTESLYFYSGLKEFKVEGSVSEVSVPLSAREYKPVQTLSAVAEDTDLVHVYIIFPSHRPPIRDGATSLTFTNWTNIRFFGSTSLKPFDPIKLNIPNDITVAVETISTTSNAYKHSILSDWIINVPKGRMSRPGGELLLTDFSPKFIDETKLHIDKGPPTVITPDHYIKSPSGHSIAIIYDISVNEEWKRDDADFDGYDLETEITNNSDPYDRESTPFSKNFGQQDPFSKTPGSNSGAPSLDLPPEILKTTVDAQVGRLPTNAKIGIQFSQDMEDSSVNHGTILLYEYFEPVQSPNQSPVNTFGPLPEGAFPVTGTVFHDGDLAFFKPNNNLISFYTYYLVVTSEVKNKGSIKMESEFIMSFETGDGPDTTPPFVSNTIPNDLASNVPISSNIYVYFNEILDPNSFEPQFFKLLTEGTEVEGEVTFDIDNIRFEPKTPLQSNKRYEINVSPGLLDLADNIMSTQYISVFDTGILLSFATPTVTETSPQDGATLTQGAFAGQFDITVRFDKDMDASSFTSESFTLSKAGSTGTNNRKVLGTTYYDFSNKTAFFTASESLLPNTLYSVKLTTAIRDTQGFNLSSDKVFSFTTAP
jgi:hypothetical protein